MTLPTGDDQTLVWKIVVEAAKALKDIQDMRQKVDELKAVMRQTAKETGESFDAIKVSMGATLKKSLDDAKASVKSLSDTLKNLQQQAKTKIDPQTGQQFSPAGLAEVNNQIKIQKDLLTAATAKVNEQTAAYNKFKQTAPTAVRELNKEAKDASKSMGGLGGIAQTFFGVTLASLAVSALRSVVNLLKEAAQSGYDFVKAIYQLEVGIRALRRAGVEITFTEFTDNLDRLREKFTVFSKKELVEGGAAFVNLIRDMGFTKNEIFGLQDAIATLAIVNGRAMDDVQRTVALALSSGYTEGLQRLGISINRVNIAQKAATLGYKGGYNALTEIQRAEATRILILEKTAKYENDLIAYRKTEAGQLDELKAKNKDLAAVLGKDLIPAMQLWQVTLGGIYEALSGIMKVIGPILGFFADLSKAESSLSGLQNLNPATWGKSIGEWFKRGAEAAAKTLQKFFGDTKFGDMLGIKPIDTSTFIEEVDVGEAEDEVAQALSNIFEDFADIGAEGSDKLKALEADLQSDLADIAQRGKEKREDIWQDYWDDIAKINREGIQKEAELYTDYQSKLKKIDLDLEFDIQKADFKFDFDVAETAIKLNEDIAKANENFRQKEADRERKYNEELLQLRENYLVDLEEALSSRDAKAVLRARKELTLAKDRAARENEFDKIKNQEGLAEDIRDAQLRREARIRELQFELEQRRLELERQAQFDREMAFAGYQADLEALRLSIQQEKAERAIAREEDLRDQLIDEQRDVERRKAKYEAELEELKAFNDEKIKLLGEALAAQAALINISNEEVLKNIEAFFGEGGLAIQIYEAFLKNVQDLVESYRTSFAGMSEKFDPGTITSSKPPGFATGGAVVARKPTEVTFGEVPEVAIFSPLSEIDKLPSLLGGLIGSNVGNGTGNLGIRIALSPGLEAEIVENAMNGIANVMFEVQRQ